VFESRYRKLFLGLTGMVLLTQIIVCVSALPKIAHPSPLSPSQPHSQPTMDQPRANSGVPR
jgi:hypothetical protein